MTKPISLSYVTNTCDWHSDHEFFEVGSQFNSYGLKFNRNDDDQITDRQTLNASIDGVELYS
jgi:hypothetical protein